MDDFAIDLIDSDAPPYRTTAAALLAENPGEVEVAQAIDSLRSGAPEVQLDFGAGGRVLFRRVTAEEEGPDLFGGIGPLPALRPEPPPPPADDLTAAAEARAYRSGRPLSQERAEILAGRLLPVPADKRPVLALFARLGGVRRSKARTRANAPKPQRRPA